MERVLERGSTFEKELEQNFEQKWKAKDKESFPLDPEYRNDYRVEEVRADGAWEEELLERREFYDINEDAERRHYLDA
jgi:hypothetical protein